MKELVEMKIPLLRRSMNSELLTDERKSRKMREKTEMKIQSLRRSMNFELLTGDRKSNKIVKNKHKIRDETGKKSNTRKKETRGGN